MKLRTRAVHSGRLASPEGDVADPIHLSTTFERSPDGELVGPSVYSRDANPNRRALEEALADLEGGDEGFCFGSGTAALHALLQTLEPGDHVVAPRTAYYGTVELLTGLLQRWGLAVTLVDPDVAGVAAAIGPATRWVLVETPSNPVLEVTDIEAVARLAHAAGARCAVDNTWLTPVFQRPLDLGADAVWHSTTKYLGGHSDVVGGAVVTSAAVADTAERLRWIQQHAGAVPSPFDCWLVRRGLRTLGCRIEAQGRSAVQLAEALATHSAVERVHFPGLESDPGHQISRRQTEGWGAMLSFQVRGGWDAARDVLGGCRLWTRATSLGGVESLIEHRAAVEGEGSRAPRGLLRLSVGLEDPDDLWDDLASSLGRVAGR